jgi:branched-chain amino acid transport system permease protein
MVVHWAFIHGRDITMGAGGFSVPSSDLGSVFLDARGAVYYLSLLTMVVVVWGTRNLIASNFGRTLLCLSEQEFIAPCLGINVFGCKVIVFALSGFIAGLAGGLYAITLKYVEPESFHITQMIIHFCMIAIGGLGSLIGSILGAMVLTLLPEALRAFKGLQEIFLGILLLGCIVFFPGGLKGLIERLIPQFKERRHGV